MSIPVKPEGTGDTSLLVLSSRPNEVIAVITPTGIIYLDAWHVDIHWNRKHTGRIAVRASKSMKITRVPREQMFPPTSLS